MTGSQGNGETQNEKKRESGKENEEKVRMERLVKLAKGRDADAFSLLYEMVYTDLYRMALYTLGNPHDAEDIVGETVLDAYVGIGGLRDETAFRSWIFRILSNKCKHKIREYVKEKAFLEWDCTEDLGGGNHAPSSGQIDNLLDRQDIARAFASISPEERLIVTMVVYGGYTSREVAAVLRKNRNTIRSKYRRALEKMQRQLEME